MLLMRWERADSLDSVTSSSSVSSENRPSERTHSDMVKNLIDKQSTVYLHFFKPLNNKKGEFIICEYVTHRSWPRLGNTLIKCSTHYLEAIQWLESDAWEGRGVSPSICGPFFSCSSPNESQDVTERPSISVLQNNEQFEANCHAQAELLPLESHPSQFIPPTGTEVKTHHHHHHLHPNPWRSRAWKHFATLNPMAND